MCAVLCLVWFDVHFRFNAHHDKETKLVWEMAGILMSTWASRRRHENWREIQWPSGQWKWVSMGIGGKFNAYRNNGEKWREIQWPSGQRKWVRMGISGKFNAYRNNGGYWCPLIMAREKSVEHLANYMPKNSQQIMHSKCLRILYGMRLQWALNITHRCFMTSWHTHTHHDMYDNATNPSWRSHNLLSIDEQTFTAIGRDAIVMINTLWRSALFMKWMLAQRSVPSWSASCTRWMLAQWTVALWWSASFAKRMLAQRIIYLSNLCNGDTLVKRIVHRMNACSTDRFVTHIILMNACSMDCDTLVKRIIQETNACSTDYQLWSMSFTRLMLAQWIMTLWWSASFAEWMLAQRIINLSIICNGDTLVKRIVHRMNACSTDCFATHIILMNACSMDCDTRTQCDD